MKRSIVFVLIAGCAAMAAAVMVYSALQRRDAELQAAIVKAVELVVAARSLPAGARIDPGAIKAVRWPKDSLPPGAFTNPALVINQFTKTSFVPNEPIVADRLFDSAKNPGLLPLLIPPGMRAMSVPVDEVSDVAGFVLPHTRVDVLVSIVSGANGNQPFSQIVLQNIEVLAVAQQTEKANSDVPKVPRVVTLLVRPDEAERLTLASHEGGLRLAMRNYADRSIIATNGVSIAAMLNAYSRPQTTAATPRIASAHRGPRAAPLEVEVMRDGKSDQTLAFDHTRNAAFVEGSAEAISPAGPNPRAHDTPQHGGELAPEAPAAIAAAPPTDNRRARDLIAPLTTIARLNAAGFTSAHAKTIDVP